MPKRVHRKRMTKRMNKRGGEPVNPPPPPPPVDVEKAVPPQPTTYQAVTNAVVGVGESAKHGVEGTAGWFGSFFEAAPEKKCCPCPSSSVQAAGSRRRKRSGKKSKNMFSGLMKMVGFKTKKRGRKGGIGGPSNGYDHIVGANFPSAANAQGNTIYDLAPFDPLKPFTGGMKGVMKGGYMPSKFIPLSPAPFPGDGMIGGCMTNKFIPLSPAPYPSDSLMGGKSKRNRKRRGGTRKW